MRAEQQRLRRGLASARTPPTEPALAPGAAAARLRRDARRLTARVTVRHLARRQPALGGRACARRRPARAGAALARARGRSVAPADAELVRKLARIVVALQRLSHLPARVRRTCTCACT